MIDTPHATPSRTGDPDPADYANASTDPKDWVTGDAPTTAEQAAYLEALCREAGVELDAGLTRGAAAEPIDQLRAEIPRFAATEGEPDGGPQGRGAWRRAGRSDGRPVAELPPRRRGRRRRRGLRLARSRRLLFLRSGRHRSAPFLPGPRVPPPRFRLQSNPAEARFQGTLVPRNQIHPTVLQSRIAHEDFRKVNIRRVSRP